MSKRNSIILLSGGLDSLVSLGLKKDSVALAITFDYGQKSAKEEIEASRKICEYYNVEHKVIKLDWLKEITNTTLVAGDVPTISIDKLDDESTKDSVWVPNRNALFINIAGAFADSVGYEYIIIGANKEEATAFPDNTEEFIKRVNKVFEYSTRVKPQVIAPLIIFNKNDIVKSAVENNIPLKLARSCYNGNSKHCGECESCQRLKRALKSNGLDSLVKEMFLK